MQYQAKATGHRAAINSWYEGKEGLQISDLQVQSLSRPLFIFTEPCEPERPEL